MVTHSPVTNMPDIEALVISKLNELAIAPTYTHLPTDPPAEFCIIHMSGGGVVHRSKWYALDVHFDVYATNKSDARLLANRVRQALIEAEGSRWTHTEVGTITGYVSRVADTTNIQWLPDPVETPNLARYILGLAFTCCQ